MVDLFKYRLLLKIDTLKALALPGAGKLRVHYQVNAFSNQTVATNHLSASKEISIPIPSQLREFHLTNRESILKTISFYKYSSNGFGL
jgi:hypothetical protein